MIRKTLEKSARGVALIRVEDMSVPARPVALGFRLTTPWASIQIADQAQAYAAFAAVMKTPDLKPASRKRVGAGG